MGQQFEASPIHRAVQYGHDNLVSLLLGHKVNINSTDQSLGRTALHYAAEYNRPTLAKLLIQKGATVDAVDNAGEVCVVYVCSLS
jgi:ankyrin repeat protein